MNDSEIENEGLDLLNKGKFEEALKAIDKILEKNSDNNVILTRKGLVLKEMGRYNEAIESLTKALSINPNFSEALYTLGNVYENVGDLSSALGYYNKSIMIDPENAISWAYKGKILYTLGKITEAVECLDTALKFNPNLKLALEKKEIISRYLDRNKDELVKQLEKGLSLKNQEKFEEALKTYNFILKLFLDDNTIKYCNEQIRELKDIILKKEKKLIAENEILAEIDKLYKKAKEQSSLNNYRDEITLLDKALKLDPNRKELWTLKGIALENLHNYSIALDNYVEALKLNPEDNTLLVHQGKILMYLGRWDEALDVFDKILTLNPNSQHVENLRKNAIKQRNTYKEFEQKLEDNLDKGEKWFRKGLFFKNLEFLEVSLVFFEKSLEFNPNNEETLYWKGIMLLQMGEIVEGIKLFEEVLKINKDFYKAKAAKIEALINSGEHLKAVSYSKDVLLNDPNNYELWNRLGELYFRTKNYEEALNSFEMALSINSKFEPSLNNKGVVLTKLKYKPEIYFPISLYKVNSIIPPDHDIIYSTLCKTSTNKMDGRKSVTYIFTCHAIFTNYGLAINMPISFSSSSTKSILTYYPWHFITIKTRGISVGFKVDSVLGARMKSPLFRLEKNDSETRKEFGVRKRRFIEKFKDLEMEKKLEMEHIIYNLLMDKPELRKKKKFKNSYPGKASKKIYYRALRRVKGQ